MARITAVACALAAIALAVRLYAIDESILTFHPTRQYRSAIIARACYHDSRRDFPDWVRRVSAANRAIQPVGEPPLLERAACAAYRLIGRESLTIPRALSALFWVAGGLPLFLIGLRMLPPAAALIGLSIYLFAPYGIVASRIFQPDPLMTLWAVVALWALVRHHEQPSPSRVVVAALAIAVAALVKPMSIFVTVVPAIGLTWSRKGVKRAASDRHLLTLLALGLLPPVLYYGYSTVYGTLTRDQWQMRFVPALLDSSFFWNGWLIQIQRVFGVPLFFLGLAGAALAPDRWVRALLAGLWSGYALFAIAFTYHMPTHDYYHLPFLAASALGIVAVTARARIALADRVDPRRLEAAAMLVAASVAVGGSLSAWPRLSVSNAGEQLRDYREIGELAAHADRVLFLDHEYGYPLMYHAAVGGDSWPSADDLTAEALAGAGQIDASARFARDFEDYNPQYFVATDLESLDSQPDLQSLLRERTVLVKATSTYHVYRFVARFPLAIGSVDPRSKGGRE